MIAVGTQANPLSEKHIEAQSGIELSEIFLSIAPFLDGVQHQLSNQFSEFDGEISPYAEYALSRQGKQLRAALTGLAANCVGGWNDSVIKAAVIVIMLPVNHPIHGLRCGTYRHAACAVVAVPHVGFEVHAVCLAITNRDRGAGGVDAAVAAIRCRLTSG